MNIKLSDHFTTSKLLRFVFPSIVMMIFTSIYGVVDGLFISNYAGTTAFAAINLVMPFLMIFGGVGFMFGTGGSALVAKSLGEGEELLAKRYFTMIVGVTVAVGIIVSAVGVIFMRPIAVLLGAKNYMINDCVTYGRVVLSFNAAFMLQNVFQSFFVAAQKPNYGLYTTLAAGVTNMVLDALFIGGFNMGVAGAAIATGISQCVGGVIPLIYFLRPNSSLLCLVKTKPQIRPILRACGNGSSEMVSNITASIVGMLYNAQLLKYAGSNGVAAYGVIMYVEFIFVAVFIGYSIGSAPIISFNYGAGNDKELKNVFKKSNFFMLFVGIAMALAAYFLAPAFAKIFVSRDAEVLKMTVDGMKTIAVTYLLVGFNIFASSFFTALNNGVVSAVISVLRTFLFKLSLVLILPLVLGLSGIWQATVFAEVLAFIISFIFIAANRRKYKYI